MGDLVEDVAHSFFFVRYGTMISSIILRASVVLLKYSRFMLSENEFRKSKQVKFWTVVPLVDQLDQDKLCFFLNGFGNQYFRSSFCSPNINYSKKWTFCPAVSKHNKIQVELRISFDQRFCRANRYRSRNQASMMSHSR